MTVLSFKDAQFNRFKRGLDDLFNKTMCDCIDIFNADDNELEARINALSPASRQFIETLNVDGLKSKCLTQGIDDELFEFMMDSSIKMAKIAKIAS